MKRKIFLFGLAALLLLCAVFVFADDAVPAISENMEKGFGCFEMHGGHGFFGRFMGNIKERPDFLADVNREEIRSAMRNKFLEVPCDVNISDFRATILENLGLPDGAIMKEIKSARMKNFLEMHSMNPDKVKESFGLPEDASKEEFSEAFSEWRQEHKRLFGFGMHHMRGIQAD